MNEHNSPSASQKHQIPPKQHAHLAHEIAATNGACIVREFLAQQVALRGRLLVAIAAQETRRRVDHEPS